MAPEKTLIEAFIEEQQRLTAVDRFAHQYEMDELLLPTHRYRDLLPASPPGPGEQYAFEVDLDKCSGCKACVTACHSLNGLDENEMWRDVGLLVEAPRRRRDATAVVMTNLTSSQAFAAPAAASLQHVTTACHHCIDPACLNGCPVLAYDKDPTTGIVRHLDDQCIGCQYCVLKCPYDVPKYNARLGIVRKCDMCANRLEVNEAPACAQSCPNEAIHITKVRTETVTSEFRHHAAPFLFDGRRGDYTLPTTRYVARPATMRNVVPADFAEVKPQPAHWPLVFMLVLMQAAVGITSVSSLPQFAAFKTKLLWLSLASAGIGFGASVFHLGRPLGAWRGFLNLRRSWMSREIVAFAAFMTLLPMAVAVRGMNVVAMAAGLAAVFCSAMIYADTRRELWLARRSVTLFFASTALLGAASAVALRPMNLWFASTLVGLTIFKLVAEASVLRHNTARTLTPMRKTALLISRTFQGVAFARCAAALVGGLGLPLLLSTGAMTFPHAFAIGGFVLLIGGEICERYLFFRCVVAPKMPGGLPT